MRAHTHPCTRMHTHAHTHTHIHALHQNILQARDKCLSTTSNPQPLQLCIAHYVPPSSPGQQPSPANTLACPWHKRQLYCLPDTKCQDTVLSCLETEEVSSWPNQMSEVKSSSVISCSSLAQELGKNTAHQRTQEVILEKIHTLHWPYTSHVLDTTKQERSNKDNNKQVTKGDKCLFLGSAVHIMVLGDFQANKVPTGRASRPAEQFHPPKSIAALSAPTCPSDFSWLRKHRQKGTANVLLAFFA